MTVDTFTREQFEQALPTKDTDKPLWTALDAYLVPVNGGRVAAEVRSSVGSNGVSAEAGADSIRCWLVDTETSKPVGSKVSRWITRQPGWQERLTKELRVLWQWRMRAGDCPKCKEPKGIWKVKKAGPNKGRPFASCRACDSGFVWLDEEPKKEVYFVNSCSNTSGADESDKSDENKQLRDEKQSSSVPLEVEAGEGAGITPPESGQSASTSTFKFPLGKKAVDIAVDEDEDDDEPVQRDRLAATMNEYQQAVVDALAKGAQVIEACPGSGKTRTLENLVAALIESGVNSDKIGVFTFSNSAAGEARHRIALTLWPDIDQRALDFITEPFEHKDAFGDDWLDKKPGRRMLVDWTCTIHALSFRLLKELTGQKFQVLSGKYQWETDSLIKDSLQEMDWEESPESVKAYIGLAIRSLILPAKANEFYSQILAGTDVAWHAGDLAEIFRRYYDFCKARNLLDFDMMQARVAWLLRNDPGFKKQAQAKFEYILVDEAQDTSPQQAEILWTLAKVSGNIVFCGDVDQSMFGFRGAVPSVLRDDFEQEWPNVVRYNLPVNYRSTRAIIRTASQLIEHNYRGPDDPYLKPFESRPDAEDGDPVTYAGLEMFADLCSETATLVAENPQDWFILSRTRAECAAIHLELVRRGIPAVNKSGGILFGAPHVRKVLAYARLACDYQDARDDLEILSEIANVATVEFKAPFTRRRHRDGCTNQKGWVDCGCPTIAEGDIDYSHTRFYGQKAIQDAGGWNGVLRQRDEANRGGYPTTRAKGASDLVRFVQRLEKLKDDAGACLGMVISDCVLPWLEAEYGIDSADLAENGKAEDLSLLTSMVKEGQSMEEYLDEAESLIRGDAGQDEQQACTLGTVHWSKGRESSCVILNATRLPIVPPMQRPGKLPMGKPPEIAEERRLAYVAITRAKTQCMVLTASEWNGQPVEESRFVQEMRLS